MNGSSDGERPAPAKSTVTAAKPRNQRLGALVAYVALGGNLGTRDQIASRFAGAIAMIEDWPETLSVVASALYWTDPVGAVLDQPRFLNGALAVSTERAIDPQRLLRRLQTIEQAHGRERDRPCSGGPRTLDLDLLLYGDRVCESEILSLPHPRLHERSFVLQPLCDLAGRDLEIPGRGAVGPLLDALFAAAPSSLGGALSMPEHADDISPVPVDDDQRDGHSQGD